jgi:hypothetical protein
MYVASVPNRNSPPCVLLRESYRVGRRTFQRTLANLTSWPSELIENFKILLKGGHAQPGSLEDSFEICRSRPHGHAYAVRATMDKLGLPALIGRSPGRERDLILGAVAGRILFESYSKLALARELSTATASTTLGELCGLDAVRVEDIYDAMRWLLPRQQKIEKALAQRHLTEGVLVLYDLTSTWYEGECCPLAEFGHNRDGKRGKRQINIGLLCDSQGRPIAVEVFKGSTGDPDTVASQIAKLRERFGLRKIVLAGDRGMLTSARIREELAGVEDLGWISALTSKSIAKLVHAHAFQPELFDGERMLAEIDSQELFPGERLVVCRNPRLAKERAAKRQELLQATEEALSSIRQCVHRQRAPYRGKDKIAGRVQREAAKYKMLKHFELDIGEDSLRWQRKEDSIRAEAALDGFYVIRAGRIERAEMSSERLVESYKALGCVEQAFRCLKTTDLHMRPIFHHLEDMVRAHALICMLAYYVDWHMRQALAPMLFAEDDPQGAAAKRSNPVDAAQPSDSAEAKAREKTDAAGRPVHSFRTLLARLGTIVESKLRPKLEGATPFRKITQPDSEQIRAFELLGLKAP